jgi:GNAT superfamily N-acetyltransferase
MKELGPTELVQIVPATEEHLPALAELAGVTWRQHYPGIISPAQIDYMLARMYSLDTLRGEIRSKEIWFVRLLVDERFVGFASCGPTHESSLMKLHKCYLLPELHGRGLGGLLLQHCERAVHQFGARRLILAVNKRNLKAVTAYQRNGFTVAESVITNFGSGFVMDDYIMAKDLTPKLAQTEPPLPPLGKNDSAFASPTRRCVEKLILFP